MFMFNKKRKTKIIKRKKEILELYNLANENPELAMNIIEPQIDQPYTRALASNIKRNDIIKMSDYHVQNYYQDILYKLWNYADKIKKGVANNE